MYSGLSEDLATLINNRQGSDIQFKIGGNDDAAPGENGDTTQNESTTIYAHSIILRCRSTYFAAMLDAENQWKESTEGVIYKPNVSPRTFLGVLRYIYAGEVNAEGSKHLLDLIAAAEEMDLDELSVECQENFILSVNGDIYSTSNSKELEKSDYQPIPVEVIVREHIFPALELAKSHNLSDFYKSITSLILSRITTIIASPEAYTSFLNLVSSKYLGQILASDDLFLPERNIWDIALSWACHQTNLSKPAVDTRIRAIMSAEDSNQENEGEDNDDVVEAGSSDKMIVDDSDNNLEEHNQESCNHSLISMAQLKQLKTVLAPFLPSIRFIFFEQEDYEHFMDILNYFLSPQRCLKLQRFFLNYDCTKELAVGRNHSSKIVVEPTACMFLREHIFKTGAINGCNSSKNLKFSLLFRASKYGYYPFHRFCDDQGPTLVIFKSTDGYIFGGVNFVSWSSTDGWAKSLSNFLFALPDGCHRKNPLIFRCHKASSTFNDVNLGPSFGNDLRITRYGQGFSKLPESYKGNEASKTALAGSSEFRLSDYEVYAISKK